MGRFGVIMSLFFRRSKGVISNTFEGGNSETFSPTMLQVQTSPPAPLARVTGFFVVLFLFVFVSWSIWADFDIVVSAPGVATPSSKTKAIQSIDAGRILSIHVKDGDNIEAGKVVVQLDSTLTGADRVKSEHESDEAHLDVLRLSAQLAGDSSFDASSIDVSKSSFDRHKHLLQSRVEEHEYKISLLMQEVASKRAELRSTVALVEKIEATIPMLQQRLSMREKLLSEGFISEMIVIESRLEVSSQISELAVQRGKIKEVESALRVAELAVKQAQSEYISRVSAELSDAQRRLSLGQQEVVKASYREDFQSLTSPIDGVVQQLSVHTIGGVVAAGQQLMTVVPNEGGIEIELKLPNKDVGFLAVGMPVVVKLDSFEFTKYGALEGMVQWIGADAIKDEMLGSYYPARVVLKSDMLPVAVNGVNPRVRIGMTVTADINIGQRKAYEFFLGPLLKYRGESLRER